MKSWTELKFTMHIDQLLHKVPCFISFTFTDDSKNTNENTEDKENNIKT